MTTTVASAFDEEAIEKAAREPCASDLGLIEKARCDISFATASAVIPWADRRYYGATALLYFVLGVHALGQRSCCRVAADLSFVHVEHIPLWCVMARRHVMGRKESHRLGTILGMLPTIMALVPLS